LPQILALEEEEVVVATPRYLQMSRSCYSPQSRRLLTIPRFMKGSLRESHQCLHNVRSSLQLAARVGTLQRCTWSQIDATIPARYTMPNGASGVAVSDTGEVAVNTRQLLRRSKSCCSPRLRRHLITSIVHLRRADSRCCHRARSFELARSN